MNIIYNGALHINKIYFPFLQSSQTAFQEQHINDPDLGDDELFSVLNDDMPEGMSDFHDIFSTWPEADGTGGPRSPEGPGGPGRGGRPDSPSPTPPHSHPHSPYQHSIARTVRID